MKIDLRLDKEVQNYAVFGNPVSHSKSPLIHSLFARQTNIHLHYQAIEVPVDAFPVYLNAFAAQSGKGLNITVPFKQAAYNACQVLSNAANKAQSVNTISCDDSGQNHGDTTDGNGLLNDLTINNDVVIKDRSVLVLGAGGSVRAILEPLCNAQPQTLVIANRTLSKAEQLAEQFSDLNNIEVSAFNELDQWQFDLIINATSSSLSGELPPLPDSILKPGACCYDLMYAETDTVFMQWARAQGAAKVLDGIGMLVEQAAESFLIWHGVKPETVPVMQALRKPQ